MKALHTYKYYDYVVEMKEKDSEVGVSITKDGKTLFEDDHFTSLLSARNFSNMWILEDLSCQKKHGYC